MKIVTFNHIRHKPIGGNVSPLIQKLGNVPTYTTDENAVDETVDCNKSGTPLPYGFPSS